MSPEKTEFTFPKILEPYMLSYQDMCAAILGWTLIDPLYIESVVNKYESDEIHLELKSSVDTNRNKVSFSFKEHIKVLNTKDIRPNRYLSFLSQITIGHCWEILQIEYKKKTNLKLKSHPDPKVQFLKHIRNGCFHSNRLYIRGSLSSGEAKWRFLEIKNEDNGRKVFPDEVNSQSILDFGDTLLLLCDVSNTVNSG